MQKPQIDRQEVLEAIAREQAQEEHEETTIQAVTRAITDAKNLALLYVDSKGRKTSRVIEPLGLKRSKAGDLSILAWDLGKEAYRQFRSDRLETMGQL